MPQTDYTLNTIIGRVRRKLDDDDYPAEVITEFVNDTQEEIFNTYELPFNQTTFSGTLSEGEHRFNFVNTAPDYQRVVSLRITGPDKQYYDISDKYMNYRDFRKQYPVPENNQANSPSNWTTYGFTIIFSQPTDKDYVMDMDYLKEAERITDEGVSPELPQTWQEVIVLGAWIRALERNDDNDLAEYHRSKRGGYLDQMQGLANRYNPAQTASTTIMRNSRRKRGR